MKKLIAFLLVLSMVLGMVACAAPAAEAPAAEAAPAAAPAAEAAPAAAEAPAALPYEGVNLKLWIAPFARDDADKAFWDEHLAGFTAETGATVDVEVVGWGDMATKYLTGFMSDDAADVIYMTNEILYDFINQGCLADVTSYWTDEEIANENFWDATFYAGKHYMVPFVGGTGYRGYCYNMDILNECGVTELPTTWDEFLAVCDAIHTKRPDLYAFLTPMTGNNNAFLSNMLLFMYQAGGSMVNADATAYTMNTPETLKAMQYIMQLVDAGYLSTDALGLEDGNVRDLFSEGKVGITVTDCPYMYVDESINYTFSTALSETKAASFCPVDTLAVNAKAVNMDAAVALIKYMRSDAVMVDFFDQMYKGGQILKSYPNVVTDAHMTDTLAHSERAFTLPVAPNLQLVVDSCMTNQQLMVMGTLTPEQALEQIQVEADKAFN